MKSLGQIAYEAYCIKVNGLSYNSVVLPMWDCTTDGIRDAWQFAAQAVMLKLAVDKEVK